MAKKIYVGVSNKARKGKKIYVGVVNKARKGIKAYIGDENGKARQWWPSIVYVLKNIFTAAKGMVNYDFTSWITASPDNQAQLKEYTSYYSGDYGTAYRYRAKYSCLNCLDARSGTIGPNNPVKYIQDGNTWLLEIPGGDSEWWLTIPTLIFNLTKIEFMVDGFSSFNIVRVGIATRASDEGVETPNVTQVSDIIGTATYRTLTLNVNNIRADYIYINVSNSIFTGGTKLRVRSIKATFERTYGIVNGEDYPFYINFARFAKATSNIPTELLVTAATSAVYMLLFNENNTYADDHIYTDVENGDGWGSGNTYAVFISKNTFTINWCSGTTIGQAETIQTGVSDNKTIYYFIYTLTSTEAGNTEPFYNYAYTYYDGWANEPNIAQIIAGMGKKILFDGPIQ